LVGRTIHILADFLKSNDTIRFGLLDYTQDENLKTTLIGQVQPRIVILKEGNVYVVSGIRDNY